MLDLSVLEPLLADSLVTEVMVNRYDEIYVERQGHLEKTESRFDDEATLRTFIRDLLASVGRELDLANPIMDFQLSDGTLCNIVMPPITPQGAVVTLRKFHRNDFTMQTIVDFGSLSPQMAQFLEMCVAGRVNMVIGGGTASGKTTVFNILTHSIPAQDRVIVVEHQPELSPKIEHVLYLFARPANMNGEGAISAESLLRNAFKMRPDRMLLTEARGSEVREILAAMSTGHEGSMFTIHATSVRDTLARIEVMATMGSVDAPLLTIREQIASSIQLIVSQQRHADGKRRITQLTEVLGTENGNIKTQDIFTYDEVQGFKATGNIPTFLPRLQQAGFDIDASFFTG
jgi:pilus assembly protein CpaF